MTLPADISTEYWRISHLVVCGFHIRGLGLIQTEEILFVGGDLPGLFKDFGFVSMSACLCAYKAASMDRVHEKIYLRPRASVCIRRNTNMNLCMQGDVHSSMICVPLSNDQISHGFVLCRVIFLQVSMNEGLSYITSSVHITTTECVSTSCVYSLHYHIITT